MDVFFSPVARLEHSITRKSARFRARYYICIKEYEEKKRKKYMYSKMKLFQWITQEKRLREQRSRLLLFVKKSETDV